MRKEYDLGGDDSSYDGTVGGRPVLYAGVTWDFPGVQAESGLLGFDVVLHTGSDPTIESARIGPIRHVMDTTAVDAAIKIPSKKTGTATVNASVRAVFKFGNGPWATSGTPDTQTTGTVVVPGITATATIAAPTADGLVIAGGGTTIALAKASDTTGGGLATGAQDIPSGTKTFNGDIELKAGAGYKITFSDGTQQTTAASAGITALTGDVTASGTGSVAATIAADAVTNSKLANMAAGTVKANTTGSSGDPTDVTLSAFGTAISPYVSPGSIPPSGVTFSPADFMVFGSGGDGDLSAGFGTIDLTTGSGFSYGTKFYRNVTFGAGDKIKCYGWHLFVSGTLDISAADAGAISMTAGPTGNGNNGSSSSGGTQGSPISNTGGQLGFGTSGSAGGSGATGAGGASAGGNAPSPSNGGSAGKGGVGGTGTGGNTGGTTLSGVSRIPCSDYTLHPNIGARVTASGLTIIGGGCGGGGGSGGGGDNTNAGGGGGGGGASGGVLVVCANTIARGTNTNAVFSVRGGNGGNGATQSTGNVGGGGGGGGGGAGWFILAYKNLTGSTITGCIDASGGTGGNGGNGVGTGSGGAGGNSGGSGLVMIFDMNNGATITQPVAPVTGGAASGATGGTGASNSQLINL